MLNFTIFNYDKFAQGSAFFPIILLLAKCIGAITVQAFSIYSMMTYTTVWRAMNGFVSHALIAKIGKIAG